MIRTIRSGISGLAIAGGMLAALFSAVPAFASGPAAVPKLGPKPVMLAPAIAGQRTGNDALYGVSCVSWTRCVAVGTRLVGSSALRPLAEQWTGTRWQVAAVPGPAKMPRAILGSVSCQSRNNCVAVGYHFGQRYALLAEAWNGRRWQIIRSANPAGEFSAFFNAISCQPRLGCLAVGGHSGRTGSGHAFADRWVSGHWQALRLRSPAGAQATELNGISCDAGACMAVGEYLDANGRGWTLAERWNGKSWQLLHSVSVRAPLSVLYDVSCETAKVCMAVGNSQWTRQYPLAELWQNGRWQRVFGGKVPGGILNGVSCQAKSGCMAVGTRGSKPLTESWSGKNWRVTQTPKASRRLTGALSQLSCRTGKGRCVTVGDRFAPSAPSAQTTLAEWWGGKTWRLMTTRNP
jgi:photosystem II stability/assembly factor-like uncharacterized protein